MPFNGPLDPGPATLNAPHSRHNPGRRSVISRLIRAGMFLSAAGCLMTAEEVSAQDGPALIPSAALTLDYTRNVSGGQQSRGGWLANLDLGLELDGGAFGWNGGSAFL